MILRHMFIVIHWLYVMACYSKLVVLGVRSSVLVPLSLCGLWQVAIKLYQTWTWWRPNIWGVNLLQATDTKGKHLQIYVSLRLSFIKFTSGWAGFPRDASESTINSYNTVTVISVEEDIFLIEHLKFNFKLNLWSCWTFFKKMWCL